MCCLQRARCVTASHVVVPHPSSGPEELSLSRKMNTLRSLSLSKIFLWEFVECVSGVLDKKQQNTLIRPVMFKTASLSCLSILLCTFRFSKKLGHPYILSLIHAQTTKHGSRAVQTIQQMYRTSCFALSALLRMKEASLAYGAAALDIIVVHTCAKPSSWVSV